MEKQKLVADSKYLDSYDVNLVQEVLDYQMSRNSIMYSICSRILDIVLSLIGLIPGIFLMLVFGLLIKIEDGGPIFYTQERVGLYGRLFNVYKLRSMRIDAERFGAQWTQENDPRILKVGTIIRKTRIDELPQLFNVLKGDMSLIGPRPERPMFTVQFNNEIEGFINRVLVKPGLTGWAQVNGGYECTPKEKLELDLYYIRNRSLFIDIKILFKTVKVVLTGEGAR